MIFPNIDPVIVEIGPVAIRWYALAYIAGLFLGLKYTNYLIQRFSPENENFTRQSLEDLFLYVAIGVILGGRLGYVLFYKLASYSDAPLDIFKIWEGGMSFHGGLLGVILAVYIFAMRRKIPVLTVGDYVAPAVPIGLFFGRIANFINAELYGRVTDVAWAVRFPDLYFPGQYLDPRHPSQLYEALTEGLLLFIILHILIHKRSRLERKGCITGLFLLLYGAARIFCEFFREPDHFLGFVFKIGEVGLTQGMILSVPMMLAGFFITTGRLRL
ncbi:MAG: prolipoprotein diacylglyceryl transferase [Pseudomonadota bacterium]